MRQAKHHCQRQTRLGRSLRIPKHRDGCSTVNRVRSSWPSLTTRVRLGRFWRIPERRDGCNVEQSRRLICQTAHGSLSTNTVKPTQPVSVSKARPRVSRSSSAVEGRRATDETQRHSTHRVRAPGRKDLTVRGLQPNEVTSSAPSRAEHRLHAVLSLKTEKQTKNKGANPKTGIVIK